MNKSCMHSEYKSHRKLQQVLWDHPKSRRRGNVPPNHQHLIRQAAISSAQTHQLDTLMLGSPCHGPFPIWHRNRYQKMGREFQGILLEREAKAHRKVSPEQVTTQFLLYCCWWISNPPTWTSTEKNTRISRAAEICRLNFWPSSFPHFTLSKSWQSFPIAPKVHTKQYAQHRHSNINLCWGEIRKTHRQHRKLSCS